MNAEGLWFAFCGQALFLTNEGQVPRGRANELFGNQIRHVHHIGEHAGLQCYGAALEDAEEARANGQFRHLKVLLDDLPEAIAHMAGRALEIIEWDSSHRYCGVCGAPTAQETVAIVRRCINSGCRREHYPRVSPVVIVAVERGEEILLGRSPHFAPGMYSTLAGFVDAGETVEAAVHREIFEESGLRVGNLRYFSSQPWPFPHSLMLGFQAEYIDGDINIARDELEDVAFFHVDRLPAILPSPSTIAHWLIRDFCRRHLRPWPLPNNVIRKTQNNENHESTSL
jgi:NAD+ diphosphatase